MKSLIGPEDAAPTQMLRLVFETLPFSAAAIFDRDLRIVCIGGELLPKIGLDRHAEGKLIADLFDGEPAALITRVCKQALAGGAADALCRFGANTFFIVAKSNAHSADITPYGVIVARDIPRDETGGVLPALIRTKARIIDRVLHEIRNPLAAVTSSADLLEKYGKSMNDETREKHVRRISGEAHRLSAVLDDILTLLD